MTLTKLTCVVLLFWWEVLVWRFCLFQNRKLVFIWAEDDMLLRAEGLKLVNGVVRRLDTTLHYVP